MKALVRGLLVAVCATFAWAGAATAQINGGPNDDTLSGTSGADIINGNGGNDLLTGFDGNDTLNGGPGNDSLRGGAGVDSYNGGAGVDRVGFLEPEATQGAVADIALQTIANDGFGNSETMISIENLGFGTALPDLFTGGGGPNLFQVGTGDTIQAGGGADSILIAGAPALINGGGGVDEIVGFLSFRHVASAGSMTQQTTTNGVSVDLAAGQIIDGWGVTGAVQNLEHVIGSGGNDTIRGNAAANRLNGSQGNDTLIGGAGADQLEGHDGADQLTGGLGADRFVYTAPAHSPPGAGRDTILDFRRAQNDRIVLSGIDADGVAPDSPFVIVPTFGGVAGQIVITTTGTTSIVQADVNGDSSSDMEIVVQHGALPLGAIDFEL